MGVNMGGNDYMFCAVSPKILGVWGGSEKGCQPPYRPITEGTTPGGGYGLKDILLLCVCIMALRMVYCV